MGECFFSPFLPRKQSSMLCSFFWELVPVILTLFETDGKSLFRDRVCWKAAVYQFLPSFSSWKAQISCLMLLIFFFFFWVFWIVLSEGFDPSSVARDEWTCSNNERLCCLERKPDYQWETWGRIACFVLFFLTWTVILAVFFFHVVFPFIPSFLFTCTSRMLQFFFFFLSSQIKTLNHVFCPPHSEKVF